MENKVIKEREDPKKKMAEIAEGNKLRKQQGRIKNRYNYLKNIDPRDRHFVYEFAKAQATEAVRYLQELKQLPFPNLRRAIENAYENDVVLKNDLCVKHNEFGELIVDGEKLKTLILPETLSVDEKENRSREERLILDSGSDPRVDAN